MKTKEICDPSPIDRFRRRSVIGFFVGIISGGDLTNFVSHPISGTLIAIFVLLIVG